MDDGTDIPTDVLVYIFERLQTNARRRLRLVCRHWRQLIDTRTATSLRSRAKTLIVTLERAYVVDDLSTEPCSEELILGTSHLVCQQPQVVGTRNGIICLCDNFGCISLYNPSTRERLAVPMMPQQEKWSQILHHTYSFTYNQATGRYMVVHVPRFFDRVMVFTLGEASWREVGTHGSWCNLQDGFVTVDNTMYWAVEDTGGKVMSFDLDGERAPSVIPLPSSRPAGTWRLAEVLGRIGIAFTKEVWVMERGASGEAKHAKWSLLYTVWVWRQRYQPKWHDNQHLTWPHFATGSNHVLTWEWLSTGGGGALYQHTASNDTTKARRGTVLISPGNHGKMLAHIKTDYDIFRRFDYVETMEPFSVYKCW